MRINSIKLCVLILSMLSFQQSVQACDRYTDNENKLKPITLNEATEKLNKILFDTGFDEDQDVTKKWQQTKCYLDSQAVFFPPTKAILKVLEALVIEHTDALGREQRRALTNKINSAIARDAGSGFILFTSTDHKSIANKATEISLFNDLLNEHCSQTTSQTCAEANGLAIKLWSLAGDFRALANSLNVEDKIDSLVYTDKIDQQWRSYKDDTILLWPQEVLLNSLFYSPAKRGLSSPPSYKLLTLRPALGLSYLSDQSHRLQPTINVDLLGAYWWKYGDKSANFKATPGRGISASMIWDGDDLAYGLTYHHNPKWSMTLAHGDENELVVSFSFQLAHWLLKR